MARWTCVQCGGNFTRDKSGDRLIRFCGNNCYHTWQKSNRNAGQFRAEQAPWNKGVKGLHFSPATEFKAGIESPHKLPIGSERVRLDKITKTPRVWVKCDSGWRLKAVVVWERENGPAPKGKVIHHDDHNSLNDVPGNLKCLTRSEHLLAHRASYEEKRQAGLQRRRLQKTGSLQDAFDQVERDEMMRSVA